MRGRVFSKSLGGVAVGFLALGLVAASAAASAPGGGWALVLRSPDAGRPFVLYSRARSGSNYDEYRLEVPVEAEPETVVAALESNLFDPTTYPGSFERRVLRSGDGVYVSYDYMHVPLLSDRDVVLRTEVGRDPATGHPQIRWYATDREGPAPREGVVRVERSEGRWIVVPDGQGGSVAIYQAHMDLGGSLPAALVDSQMPRSIAQQAIALHRRVQAGEA